MQLKSIELTGFKSFAKKSVLNFNVPITAVVGPNGSGKSNVAEAFRFVLGEQSIKSLRGKKGEDLIWNGSNDIPRAGRASAKAIFDNSNKLFDLDFPEVAIERVVNRDGVNEYLLNGSTVRLRDIFELLSKAHIGSSGHHIISQGEADKILNANSRERKAIIEDALGLKLYQFKREESEKKLEKTFENLSQVEALRKEIAPHLKFLKKQMDKIEKAESMREGLLKLSQEYFHEENLYLENFRARLHSEKLPIEEKLSHLKQELKEAKAVLENAAKANKKEYLVLELESEIAGIRALKDGFQRELGKIEGSIFVEERIIKKEEELQSSEEHKVVRLKEVEDLFEEISLWREAEKIIEKIKIFISERKRSASSDAAVEARGRTAELSKEKTRIEKELKRAEVQEKEAQNKYEALKREIEQDKDSGRDAEKAVFKIMSEENELVGKKRILETEKEKFKLEEEEFKRELEETAHLAGREVLDYKNTPHLVSLSHPSPSEGEGEGVRSIQLECKKQLQRLKIRLEDSGAGESSEMIKEFKEASERDEFLRREVEDLEKSAGSLKELIKELESRLSTEFASGLSCINEEFKVFFKEMFDGGEAKLVLIKESKGKAFNMGSQGLASGDEASQGLTLESEPNIELDFEPEKMEEGLDISVSLPRKKIKGLTMLSGGERALTSIALIFAISQVNPPPFIILDETDAALDEANSKKYGDMVEKLSKHSQLILITHNRETMGRAGTIYGVTMTSNGASKLLSIDFAEAVQVAK
ncbi:MAG: AAA family ATPase [Patescibacteria group bacterium]